MTTGTFNMELETFQYSKEKGWSVKHFPKLDSENTLILVFADPEFINNPLPLADIVRHYPKSQIIGCATPEEISGSFILGNSISLVSISHSKLIVTVIHFHHSNIKTFFIDLDEKQRKISSLGETITKQLADKQLKGIFILSECKKMQFNSLLKGLPVKQEDSSPYLTCTLATRQKNTQPSWIIFNGKIRKNAIVALGFYGEQLHITHTDNTKIEFDNEKEFPVLAISQLNENSSSHENDEYRLENTMTFLPRQTKLVGFYAAKNSLFTSDNRKDTPQVTILYERECQNVLNKTGEGFLLRGKQIAQKILNQIKQKTSYMAQSTGHVPKLAIISISDDPRSTVYLNSIKKSCLEVGIEVTASPIKKDITEQALIRLIKKLNKDKTIDGIQLHLPLPKHINKNKIVEYIALEKDVDGTHPHNLGKMIQSQTSSMQQCTAQAVMLLLKATKQNLKGKHAVVVGSSNAGMPIAIALINANCTVSICNVHTDNLSHFVGQAEILVTAVGNAQLIKGEWIKPDAIVIDMGITALPDGTIQGDVEFDTAKQKAQWITPVPGGGGPVTAAILLQHTLEAAERKQIK